nr:hypothetical protein Iba_chr01cCG12650 [Ipomoea batatas]GMC54088.1 hypothetical protein Iba_chr01dCG12850 [Ipomoea batatas]
MVTSMSPLSINLVQIMVGMVPHQIMKASSVLLKRKMNLVVIACCEEQQLGMVLPNLCLIGQRK